MTLSERLIKYMDENNVTGAALARMIEVSPVTIMNIRQGKKSSMWVVQKLVEALGDDYREYLEYQTCACGKRFIPKTSNQHHCSSECSKYFIGKAWGHRQTVLAKREKEYENEVRIQREVKRPKPKVGYAEYNERARSQGLSYGQLQGMERLGIR